MAAADVAAPTRKLCGVIPMEAKPALHVTRANKTQKDREETG